MENSPTNTVESSSLSFRPKPKTQDALADTNLIYGVWRILQEPLRGDLKKVRRLIDLCLDHGIEMFDHADIYGGYQCEELFGAAAQGIPRNRYKLMTKCGIKLVHPNRPSHKLKSYDTSAPHLIASVEKSLKNLKTDVIDILLIHRPDPLMDAAEVAHQFCLLAQSGKVKAFGVSNFKTHQIRLLQSYLPFPLVTNQIEFNLLHHDPLTDGTLDHAQEYGYRPTIWSPLGGGRLFTEETPAVQKIRSAVQTLALSQGVDPEAICLGWLMKHPSRPIPVLGTLNEKRLMAMAKATQVSLSREEWFFVYEKALGQSIP